MSGLFIGRPNMSIGLNLAKVNLKPVKIVSWGHLWQIYFGRNIQEVKINQVNIAVYSAGLGSIYRVMMVMSVYYSFKKCLLFVWKANYGLNWLYTPSIIFAVANCWKCGRMAW